MAKLKPILPALRERKRYVAFELLSKSRIKSYSSVSKAIWQGMLSFVGAKGAAQAGLWLLPERYNANSQRGIARVSHVGVDALKGSIALVQEVEGVPSIIRTVGVSGSLKKASKYIAG